MFLNLFTGVGFFLLYIFHIRNVFESRTGFSQLTPLERLSFLRKDDALYFSFYKIIAEEKSFSHGIRKLQNLTSIEYPYGINVLKRFHVLPELTIGYIYHLYKYLGRDVLGNPSKEYCFKVSDNPIAGTVMSCEDISEPFMFYLEYVWFMGGLTIFLVYMYGAFLRWVWWQYVWLNGDWVCFAVRTSSVEFILLSFMLSFIRMHLKSMNVLLLEKTSLSLLFYGKCLLCVFTCKKILREVQNNTKSKIFIM